MPCDVVCETLSRCVVSLGLSSSPGVISCRARLCRVMQCYFTVNVHVNVHENENGKR